MHTSVFFPWINPALLLPSFADLAGIGAVWVSSLLLLACGRLLTRGRTTPELALLAGWGALVLLLTCWGVLVPPSLPLWWPAVAVAGIGAAALVVPGIAPRRDDWVALGRTTVVSLPLWVVLASAQPSQPDSFLNLVPNAAYIHDHDFLPASGRPDSHSFLPGAPYNLQFWAYFAGIALPRFSAIAMAHINLALLLTFGLLLARVLQFGSREATAGAAPGWGATASGLLLAIAFNPGFVPRVWLTVYGEAAIAVCLGAVGYLIAAGFERIAMRTAAWPLLPPLAAILAALVEIKQESVAFVIALGLSIPMLGLLDRRVGFFRASVTFAPAFLPAMLLYGLWEWYVRTHLVGGELGLLPFRQWNWPLLPQILRAILATIVEKGVYFGILLIALLLLLWRLRRRPFEFATRLVALTIGVTLAYDCFLVMAYVASFAPSMASDAHSFFRYNTHLALILVLSLAALARQVAIERSTLQPPTLRVGGAAAIAIAMLFPIVFTGRLRFDLMMPQPLIRALIRDSAGFIAPNDKLALVLPGDGGSVASMMEGVLRYEAPRRARVELVVDFHADGTTLSQLADKGVTKALISCVPPGFSDLPAGHAVLLERHAQEWRMIASWRYPPRDGHHWAPSLTAGLCG